MDPYHGCLPFQSCSRGVAGGSVTRKALRSSADSVGEAGRLRRYKLIVLVVASLLIVSSTAAALNVATKGIKARPSAEYSPETAWENGHYGCNTTIAVFDNGVDDEHPYLESKFAAGYDSTVTGPLWEQANDGNPQPLLGSHGTPVAGIALSHVGEPFTAPEDKPDYGEDEMVGVAPCAWAIDVMFSDVSNDDGFEADVLEAYEWAIEHKDASWGDEDPSNDGIDIITMSWSPNDQTDGSHAICQAATKAVEAGIVVLGSAGNSGSSEEPDLGCPTGADGAISVANIWNQRTVDRSDDDLRETSTWGPRTDDGDEDPYEELKPDIAAPGHNVVSTSSAPVDGTTYQVACFGVDDFPEQTPPAVGSLLATCETSFGGTSAATPMTAGVVALMLDANPDLDPASVKSILHQTAEPHSDMNRSAQNLSAQWDHRYGYGMIDAHAATKMAESWPGLERGKDTDADGLRDAIDAGPRNPADVNLSVPPEMQAIGGNVDTDGDGVVDAEDTEPLDPFTTNETLAAAGDAEPDETPGLGAGLAAVALLVSAGLVRRRRR